MAKFVTAVPGIGGATAAVLNKHGFKTAEDLAESTPAALASVPGFGEKRAAVVIEAARGILAPGQPDPVDDLPAEVPGPGKTKTPSPADSGEAKGVKAKKTKGKKKKTKGKKGKEKSGKKADRDRKEGKEKKGSKSAKKTKGKGKTAK